MESLGTAVCQHGDGPSGYSVIVFDGGGTKVCEGSAVAFCVYGLVRILSGSSLVLAG
jgi:hypothetical protein